MTVKSGNWLRCSVVTLPTYNVKVLYNNFHDIFNAGILQNNSKFIILVADMWSVSQLCRCTHAVRVAHRNVLVSGTRNSVNNITARQLITSTRYNNGYRHSYKGFRVSIMIISNLHKLYTIKTLRIHTFLCFKSEWLQYSYKFPQVFDVVVFSKVEWKSNTFLNKYKAIIRVLKIWLPRN